MPEGTSTGGGITKEVPEMKLRLRTWLTLVTGVSILLLAGSACGGGGKKLLSLPSISKTVVAPTASERSSPRVEDWDTSWAQEKGGFKLVPVTLEGEPAPELNSVFAFDVQPTDDGGADVIIGAENVKDLRHAYFYLYYDPMRYTFQEAEHYDFIVKEGEGIRATLPAEEEGIIGIAQVLHYPYEATGVNGSGDIARVTFSHYDPSKQALESGTDAMNTHNGWSDDDPNEPTPPDTVGYRRGNNFDGETTNCGLLLGQISKGTGTTKADYRFYDDLMYVNFLNTLHGDYNGDGYNNICDITPIAVHFNKAMDFGSWDDSDNNYGYYGRKYISGDYANSIGQYTEAGDDNDTYSAVQVLADHFFENHNAFEIFVSKNSNYTSITQFTNGTFISRIRSTVIEDEVKWTEWPECSRNASYPYEWGLFIKHDPDGDGTPTNGDEKIENDDDYYLYVFLVDTNECGGDPGDPNGPTGWHADYEKYFGALNAKIHLDNDSGKFVDKYPPIKSKGSERRIRETVGGDGKEHYTDETAWTWQVHQNAVVPFKDTGDGDRTKIKVYFNKAIDVHSTDVLYKVYLLNKNDGTDPYTDGDATTYTGLSATDDSSKPPFDAYVVVPGTGSSIGEGSYYVGIRAYDAPKGAQSANYTTNTEKNEVTIAGDDRPPRWKDPNYPGIKSAEAWKDGDTWKVKVKWYEAYEPTNESPPLKYVVYWDKVDDCEGNLFDGNGDPKEGVDSAECDDGTTEADITGLTSSPTTAYVFAVRARDSHMDGETPDYNYTTNTNQGVVAVGDDTFPPEWDTTVGITSATPGNSQVTVGFGSASDPYDQSTPVSYIIYWVDWEQCGDLFNGDSVNANAYCQVYAPDPRESAPYSVVVSDNVDNGVLYEFGVRAKDSVGNEEKNTVTIKVTPSRWGTPGTIQNGSETSPTGLNLDLAVTGSTIGLTYLEADSSFPSNWQVGQTDLYVDVYYQEFNGSDWSAKSQVNLDNSDPQNEIKACFGRGAIDYDSSNRPGITWYRCSDQEIPDPNPAGGAKIPLQSAGVGTSLKGGSHLDAMPLYGAVMFSYKSSAQADWFTDAVDGFGDSPSLFGVSGLCSDLEFSYGGIPIVVYNYTKPSDIFGELRLKYYEYAETDDEDTWLPHVSGDEEDSTNAQVVASSSLYVTFPLALFTVYSSSDTPHVGCAGNNTDIANPYFFVTDSFSSWPSGDSADPWSTLGNTIDFINDNAGYMYPADTELNGSNPAMLAVDYDDLGSSGYQCKLFYRSSPTDSSPDDLGVIRFAYCEHQPDTYYASSLRTTTLRFNSSGKPAVLYPDNGNLVYREYGASSWNDPEIIVSPNATSSDRLGEVNLFSDFVFDSSDDPVIVYLDEYNDRWDLKYVEEL